MLDGRGPVGRPITRLVVPRHAALRPVACDAVGPDRAVGIGEVPGSNQTQFERGVFDTYMGGDFEKAMKKMEKQISEQVGGLKPAAPGLSIRVEGMKGPITEEELHKCKEFGIKIANQLRA